MRSNEEAPIDTEPNPGSTPQAMSGPGSEPARKPILLIVIAAIAALVVVGGGILVGLYLVDSRSTVATPSPSLSIGGPSVDPGSLSPRPPTSPAPPPTSPPPPPVKLTRLDLGATATFPNFRVTVSQVVANGAQGVLAHAEVCVRKLPPGSSGGATRVSWDPWRAVTPGQVYRAKLYDGSHPPPDMFPLETRLEVGECASGWIAFADVTDRGDVRRVAYTNSLGNKAGWLVSG